MKKLNRIRRIVEVENYSGVNINKIHSLIKPLRIGYHEMLDVSLAGDAPKDFIRVYKYGEAKKKDLKNWTRYIAKVGHKWYPIESITEYLLNCIGEVLGLNMAKSQLRLADGQIRFLSKYFLEEDETLTHGAEIYSSFLNETDNDLVDTIEELRLSKKLLTFQFTKEAIETVYPKQAKNILKDLVRLLVFDAIIGNNDRHHYNWGVITNVRSNIVKTPALSPIYDTARGLFWNYSEEKIVNFFSKRGVINKVQFNTYINKSQPKIGWENHDKVSHFELVNLIFNNYPDYSVICSELLQNEKLESIFQMLNDRFSNLFSEKRYILVKECLQERFNKLSSHCN